MFQDDYKKAYDQIKPNQDSKEQIFANVGNSHKTPLHKIWKRTVAAAVCCICICIWNVIPVCAAYIPAFYSVLESISPGIADLFVPVEKSCSSQGVIMCAEAVNLDGSRAEIIVSFQDEEGYDKIHGAVDKAYFMISVEADDAFDKSMLTFYSYRLLCGITKEERDIDLPGAGGKVETKSVTVSGRGELVTYRSIRKF